MPLSHPRRSALSEQVIAELRNQIASGEWPVGSRIPTESELVIARSFTTVPAGPARVQWMFELPVWLSK